MVEDVSFDNFSLLSEFEQVKFLDELTIDVKIDTEKEVHIVNFLSSIAVIGKTTYIRRSAFKLLTVFAITGKINNYYSALGLLEQYLGSSESILKVVALKFLPFYSESSLPNILSRVKALTEEDDGDVVSEAFICLGLAEIRNSFGKEKIFALGSLRNASIYLLSASTSSENRTDSTFFQFMVDFLIAVIENRMTKANERFEMLKNSLLNYITYEFQTQELEFNLLAFRICERLKECLAIGDGVDLWLDVRNEIEALYHVRVNCRLIADQTHGSAMRQILRDMFDTYEGYIFSNNVNKERARLEKLQTAVPTDIAQFIKDILGSLPPHIRTSASNDELLVALVKHFGTDSGLSLYQEIPNKSISSEVVNLISDLLSREKNGDLLIRTGTLAGQDVFNRLVHEIETRLPNYSTERKALFYLVLEEVIRYARSSLVGNTKARFQFLFSVKDEGKGTTAVEQDLQDSMISFFEHSRISSGLEHEKAKFVDGGRVDIVYKRDSITIPIELKKSLDRPTLETMEGNYIAQAQTYTAGYDQLGIFVLLELSDKSNDPPPNFKDWFRVHHLSPSSNLPIKYPDFIVSVIIPGNRTVPSSKSTYK
jgi:hypothetical protein